MPTDPYGQGVTWLDYGVKPDLKVMGDGIALPLTARSNMTFASGTIRDATVTEPVDGMVTYLGSEERFEGRVGGVWVELTPGPWIPISLSSGYEEQAGSPAYRKWGDTVDLRGIITKTSGGFVKGEVTQFATLPAGYRPSGTSYIPAAIGSTSGANGRVDIFTDGTVSYLIPTAATNTVTVLSLANLSFSTA